MGSIIEKKTILLLLIMTIYCLTLKKRGFLYKKNFNLYISNDIDLIAKKIFEELVAIQFKFSTKYSFAFIIQYSPNLLNPKNIRKNKIFRIDVDKGILKETNNKIFLAKYDAYHKIKEIYFIREKLLKMSKNKIQKLIDKKYPIIKYNCFTFRKTLINKIVHRKIVLLFKD
jgi:hypothetical protein